ncbi:MAG: tetratricopeptide repeat protein [Micavibrio sp.]|nr:tetratricopeptide repeat protein [Micavibrio sp.]
MKIAPKAVNRLLSALLTVTLSVSALALSAHAEDNVAKSATTDNVANSATDNVTTATMPDAATMAAAMSIPAANTLSGNYLAGRFAQGQQDWSAAQNYMNSVIDFDPENTLLEQRAFLLSVGALQYDRAHDLAEKVLSDHENAELAAIYLTCDALSRGDNKAALGYVAQLPQDGFGQYTKPLLSAWAIAGGGDVPKALKMLKMVADDNDPTYNVHAALMEEMSGDKSAAAKHYKKAMASGLTLSSALLAANFFQRNGEPEISSRIFNGISKLYPSNPFANAMKLSPAPNITRAADGAAIALFDLATLLYERRAYDSAQIYGSMVLLLQPKAPYAMMMLGDIAALHQQYGKSIDDYNAISKNSPLYWLSRMRVSEVNEISGNLDGSIAMLKDLAKDSDTHMQSLVSLGDLYRRHDQYQNALEAYDQALAGTKPDASQWSVIYARGMAQERLNHWDMAEKDLLQALQFQPDNPMILNFIGYSWADKGVHIDEALKYIRKAVALRPDDGYMVDSLGWALYRAGKYQESAEWLEKAVSIVADDSTILDHLGDAYWQTGRQTEARYKWQRAHELSKDAGFRAGLEQKMSKGIDTAPQTAHQEAKL